jgi:hypothetical protein
MWLRRLFAVEVNLQRRHFGARFLNIKHIFRNSEICVGIICTIAIRQHMSLPYIPYLITEGLVNNNCTKT